MGGIETHCQELYPRIVDRGAMVVIFARKAYTPQKTPYRYKRVQVVPVYAPKIAGLETFVHTFRCLYKVLAWKPDIPDLHAFSVSTDLWSGMKKIMNGKLVKNNVEISCKEPEH